MGGRLCGRRIRRVVSGFQGALILESCPSLVNYEARCRVAPTVYWATRIDGQRELWRISACSIGTIAKPRVKDIRSQNSAFS
jgi:hypothetical protein